MLLGINTWTYFLLLGSTTSIAICMTTCHGIWGTYLQLLPVHVNCSHA